MSATGAETVITVQGAAWSDLEPEQCILRFTIATDGPERAPVLERATAALDAVSATIAAMHDPDAGPVTRWSADRVQVSTQRPWTNDGTRLPLVHHASVSGLAVVSDVQAVADLVDALGAHETASIDSLGWSLTDARLDLERSEVRTRAVADALAKAEVLAAAIGLGSVTAVALADPGMLDGGGSGGGPSPRMEKAMMMAMDARSGGGGLSLRPELIRVEAAVDARFTAR